MSDEKKRDENGSDNVAIEMVDVGINDRMPYTKADITLAARLDETVALSFYQVDYQSVVTQKNKVGAQASGGPVRIISTPIPVAKVVFDREGFVRLHKEVAAIAKQLGIGE